MQKVRLSLFNVAMMNVKRQAKRTTFLILLIFVLAFVLFSGTFLVKSLRGGLASLSSRLGADIIVVPQGYDGKIEGALLRGEPNTFWFDISAVEKIKSVPGVVKVSPQLFIATLSASCCSFPLQIIGIDFASDFNVLPWLAKEVRLPLQDSEIVVGSNIVGNVNGELKFFGQPFMIAGRLNKTGMGFDNSVFMSIENARRLAKEYERIIRHPIAHDDSLISSVMVKIAPNAQVKKVASSIKEKFKGEQIYPLIAKKMMGNISSGIESLSTYITFLIMTLYILSFAVLVLSFSSVFNERRGEFAMMRVIGARKTVIARLAALETLIVSVPGAFFGILMSLISLLLFDKAIASSLRMPYLSPSFLWILSTALIAFIAISLIAPISSIRTVFKLTKSEIALVRQGA